MTSNAAHAISPPCWEPNEAEYWLYVEYTSNIYKIFWTIECADEPDLSSFPTGPYRRQLMAISDEMSRTLQSSTLLEYGSDAVVREQILHSFPIVKVAHPDEAARNRISHEFTMLRILSELKVPTPVFDTQALTDEKGIYRYRMERLYKLDYDKLREYKQDVEYMLRMLHSYGIAFGDLHPGNIMRNGVGELVFIDPSCAGYLEEPVPFFIRPEIYQATTFHQTQDEYRLASYFA